MSADTTRDDPAPAPGDVPAPSPAIPKRARAGMALCLSGGGFRASLFHLGAMQRLHELGLLERLTALSSVSGGSILTAHLAEQARRLGVTHLRFDDWANDVAEPFHRFVARDLRTLPILLHLPWNWLWPQFRVAHVESLYRRRLTTLQIQELPVAPAFVMCATDLTFGVNWEFSRGRVGDYRAGYVEGGGEWPLAKAVAASACFPPVFGPMRVGVPPAAYKRGSYRGDDRASLLSSLALSDGGVYDNMGLEPVWDDTRFVLVSDCGAPFDFHVGGSVVRRLLRYTSVVTSQTRALRVRMMMGEWERDVATRTVDGCYWRIGGGATARRRQNVPDAGGYSEELITAVIARTRTDLDAFLRAEMYVLENHGYFSADYAVRRNLPDLVPPGAKSPVAPYPEWMDEPKVRAAMATSHKRFSLRRWLATTFARSS